ncbi:hypothetical protein, partial [Listeria grandensis]|uniref:hypothetical protein n=1 Tax=Listeria grandensis TaxID=1494963 RepID=UPI001C9D1F59
KFEDGRHKSRWWITYSPTVPMHIVALCILCFLASFANKFEDGRHKSRWWITYSPTVPMHIVALTQQSTLRKSHNKVFPQAQSENMHHYKKEHLLI